MTDVDLDDLPLETDTKAEPAPIVDWYDDAPWRVQFVPSAVAFLGGILIGAAATLAVARLLED